MHDQKQEAMYVSRLRLKFPGEPSLLFKDLSLSVPERQKLLLLGPSGSGKSTLLQVLSGIIPHSIEVPFKAEALQSPKSWGFVFQDPDTQFCMPYVDEELAFVLENLNVPREEMEPRMQAALDLVGLRLESMHVPIETLSQGMKQRLALASVLLLEPDVLFLDEPSAMLDPAGTKQIWNAVKNTVSDKTVVIVEHKIDEVIDLVDRVILFNPEGQIIADDAPQVIFEQHKKALMAYGIWYPDVWKDYLSSHSYQAMQSHRTKEQSELEMNLAAPVLKLKQFAGFRGEEVKIEVDHAELYPGDWIAVIGENGAGKSTLLLSLMQLLETKGSYEILGEDVSQAAKYAYGGKRSLFSKIFKMKRRTKQAPPQPLAFVFQNPEWQFVANSIFDEVAFSLRIDNFSEAEIEKRTSAILDAFGLDMSHDRHPFQLSVGQKRRLSVASAMAVDKPVLLLDEPTFGLDARSTFHMLEKLEQLRQQGTAILMVTHDMHIANYFATKVWKIKQGKLVEVTAPST